MTQRIEIQCLICYQARLSRLGRGDSSYFDASAVLHLSIGFQGGRSPVSTRRDAFDVQDSRRRRRGSHRNTPY